MIIDKNIYLKNKTTFGIGGICNKFYIPETISELLLLVEKYPNAPLIAGGSNLVISDMRKFNVVISLLEFNKEIEKIDDGIYRVGASVRNQLLINKINEDGYGGIENLYSVPGTVGGAIFMNAGTGKELGKYISQYIVSVDWFDGKKIITIPLASCDFSYRHSYFQEHKGIIISAVMKFEKQTLSESKLLISERQNRVKKLQDHSGRTCGTLCKKSNKNIMRLLKLLRYGNKNGVHFSSKTPNWLLNSGEGNFIQFKKCINLVRKLHKIFGCDFELEIEVWE